MVTPSDFDWSRLVTVVGTENNRRGKNGADYWCHLLKWASTKN
jgi:hypothetical protein